MKRIPPTITLTLLLALGCSGLRSPRPTPPTVEPPATWSASSAAPGEVVPAGWWLAFADPTLEALVDEAVAANPGLGRADSRVRQAMARAAAAGGARLPSLEAAGGGSRQRQNFIGFPIPGAGDVLSTTTTTLSLSLDVSWEIDLWGRLAAAAYAAEADAQSAAEDLAAARLSLTGQTAKAWFGLSEAARQAILAEETLANRSASRRRIEKRYLLGLRGPLDLRLARSAEAEAAAELESRRQVVETAERRLEILLGRYPSGTLLEAHPPSDLAAVPELPAAGLPGELLARRPDLRAAERRLESAGFELAAARAALYPRLALSGTAGRRGLDPTDLGTPDFGVWSLVGALLQPVFQGGRLRAAVDVAEARRDELGLAWVEATLAAWSEAEIALAADRRLEFRIEALAAAVRDAEAAARLANDRYAAGLADYLAVLESERRATAAAGRLLAARRERLLNRIDLHLALGGDAGAVPTTPDPTEVRPSPSGDDA